jgi:hypothetical protein
MMGCPSNKPNEEAMPGNGTNDTANAGDLMPELGFDSDDEELSIENPLDKTISHGKLLVCPTCGEPASADDKVCPRCGTAFVTFEQYLHTGITNKSIKPKNWPTGEEIVTGQRTIHFEIRGENLDVQINDSVIVGRSNETLNEEQPDIDLTDYQAREKGVSRQHLSIKKRGALLYITDLGSTNGSYVNGRRLDPNLERLLRDGDELRLGFLDFIVRF